MITVQEFLSKLDNIKPAKGGFMARCPAHDDRQNSLQIVEKASGDRPFSFHCHAGCPGDSIIAALGLKWSDLYPARSGYAGKEEIDRTYDYVNERGELVYQVVRLRPKSFRQRRLAPGFKLDEVEQAWCAKGWINDLEGVEPLLFRLPDVLAAVKSGDPIWVCEGEKDALRLVEAGVCATCNSGGAGKWSPSFTDILRNAKSLVIVRDRDKAGGEHAKRLYTWLSKSVPSIEVIEAFAGKDAYDHLAAGYDLADFVAVDPADLSGLADKLPVVEVADRELREITGDAWRAVLRANQGDALRPAVYSFGGALARVIHDPETGPGIQPLGATERKGLLARSANWVKSQRIPPKREGERWRAKRNTVMVPKDVADDILYLAPFPDLPRLIGVSRCPVLSPEHDQVFDKPGYAAGAFRFLDVPESLEVPTCTAEESAAWILSEVLCDFPFVDDASRAHALALMLLPIVRPGIDGPVPLFLVDAPTQGSGKSLLATVCLIPGLTSVPISNAPKEDDEWRKLITTMLIQGAQCILLDNLSQKLSSDALCAALTQRRWADRILGASQSVNLPLRLIWAATSNNAKLSTDIVRRSLGIRIDAGVERPDKREGFKHENLEGWVIANRLTILGHLTNIVRAWSAQPFYSSHRKGSYETFVTTMGAILENCGVDGFTANEEQLRENADDGLGATRILLSAWWEHIGFNHETARGIRDTLHKHEPEAMEQFGEREADQVKRLGYWLRTNQDRVYRIKVASPSEGHSEGHGEGHDCMEVTVKVSKGTQSLGLNRFKLVPVEGHEGHEGHDSHPYVYAHTQRAGARSQGETSPSCPSDDLFEFETSEGHEKSASPSKPMRDLSDL